MLTVATDYKDEVDMLNSPIYVQICSINNKRLLYVFSSSKTTSDDRPGRCSCVVSTVGLRLSRARGADCVCARDELWERKRLPTVHRQ